MLKEMAKHEDKEHRETSKHEAPLSINHKATQNKNNTGTTALERSVAYHRDVQGRGVKIFLTVDKLHPSLRSDVFLNTKIHRQFGSHKCSLTQSMHRSDDTKAS